jgi:hypothetical protein
MLATEMAVADVTGSTTATCPTSPPSVAAEVIPAQKNHAYRDYSNPKQRVMDNYRLNHQNQTYEYALAQRNKYAKLDSGFELSIWYACNF